MARLEIITGPMFSGKSEELLRRLHLARHAERTVLVIKPKDDIRAINEVVSRKKMNANDKTFEKFSCLPAFEVSTPEEIEALIKEYNPDILGIDEGQFFGTEDKKHSPELVNKFVTFIKKILRCKKYKNLTVIICGLDMTSEGDEFGPMPQFMTLADEVSKLRAVCFKCKQWPANAEMTYYKGNKETVVDVGDAEKYEARCKNCWNDRSTE